MGPGFEPPRSKPRPTGEFVAHNHSGAGWCVYTLWSDGTEQRLTGAYPVETDALILAVLLDIDYADRWAPGRPMHRGQA